METPDLLYPLRGKHYEPPYRLLTRDRLIRVVELLPGQGDDEIKTRLSIVDLDQEPSYEAISYVWGDAKDKVSIVCQEHEFWISRNLHQAFRRVRLPDRTRVVWADAMCIDQTNHAEKSHHVAFMNEVYSHAEKVLICIKEDAEGSEHDVAGLISDYRQRATVIDLKCENIPKIEDEGVVVADPRWRALARLFRSQWFTRVWVLQEAGVAAHAELLYGLADLDYRALMSIMRWLLRCAGGVLSTYEISALTVHTDWFDWRAGWRARQSYTFGVIDLLSAAKGLGCGNKLDHVYGLLGHPLLRIETGSDTSTPVITPDYDSPVTTMYQNLTEKLLTTDGLKVLSAVEHDEDTIRENVPSWVARWDMDVIWNSMGYYEHFYYRASGEDYTLRPKVSKSSLQVQGVFIDTIQIVFPFSANEADWDTTEAAKALVSAGSPLSILYAIWLALHRDLQMDAMKLQHSLGLTLCTGLTNYERAENDIAQHQRNFAAFWNIFENAFADDTLDKLKTLSGQEHADSFYCDMLLACKGRAFFITERGMMGLGPLISCQGDAAYILRGARVPFVLRQSKVAGAHRLLGETYLHGVMEGEMVKSPNEAQWTDIKLV